MYIGGGVLFGGCVQEEIRFSICPELCVALIFCPVMKDCESIQIRGAQRFSSYEGYAFKLRYAGPFEDQHASADGCRSSIVAMDAYCFEDKSIGKQLSGPALLRDLNKALSAFGGQKQVATGNWGCGAFGADVRIKVLIQWAAATQACCALRIYPFGEKYGPELAALSERLCADKVQVGELVSVLSRARMLKETSELFDLIPLMIQQLR